MQKNARDDSHSSRALFYLEKEGKHKMNYKLKNQMKVGVRMSEKGADKVGNKLANAVLIFSSLAGIALILAAIKGW